MNDLDKLRILLPHWINHNIGHGSEFAKWAALLHASGRTEIAVLLQQAEGFLHEADSALKKALEKSGGALEGNEHLHHHHHKFPE